MPYIGEIRLFGGNFAPNGWAFCEGQLMPISENDALFVLIGTTYGGDGQETFALPDLRGRVPIHMGTGPSGVTYVMGESGGTETHTLTVSQLPVHSHAYTYQPVASGSNGTQTSPQNAYYAGSGRKGYYRALTDADTNMAAIGSLASTTPIGESRPINIMQPYLAVNYIISLFGVFPSPT